MRTGAVGEDVHPCDVRDGRIERTERGGGELLEGEDVVGVGRGGVVEDELLVLPAFEGGIEDDALEPFGGEDG